MQKSNSKKRRENIGFILLMVVALSILIFLEAFTTEKESSLEQLDDANINIPKLVINEIMTSNKGAFADAEGKLYDWIELYNGTNSDIDLTGYGLSDEVSGNTKWLFPAVTIKSKEYLIVYLAGTTEHGLYANFALNKAGGETITLKNKAGKVVDSVKTTSVDKNGVMARTGNGKWIETIDITPGYDNNEEGRKQFLEARKTTTDLVINEFLPNNQGNIAFDGNLYSYVELYNQGNSDISLQDYHLSNDSNRPFMWQLPDEILKPGETYLIYTSELNKENHANFTLKKKTGTVLLSYKDKIAEEVNYTNLTGGFAYIRLSDQTFREGTNITPGYPNTTDGIKDFSSSKRKNPKDLIINEVMSSNDEYLPQNGGEYYDWIELYNNTDHTITLSNYALTTNADNKKMYILPDKELKSHEYFVVMASGDSSLSNRYNHANFKISSSESIYLYQNDTLVDSMFVSNTPKGYSYGRGEKNGFYYFETPTPLASNKKTGVLEIAYEPIFQTPPGIYDDKKELAVTLEGTGTIYYTLDGSIPTTSSKVYDSPILLDKTTVIRAVSYESGKKASTVITGSYIIGENHTLPVLSISLPNSSFRNLSNHPDDTNLTVAAHAELYEKNKSFSIDCGMKLFGGQTRYISKKSFALKFKSQYGPSKLNYKVFDNREAVSYDTLVVRSGSQDTAGSMIRDELATSIMNDYGTVDVQAYKAVVLYINGEYWGVYFLREKVDEEFLAHHYNVSREGANIIRIDNVVTVGSSKDYNALRNYIHTHDMTKDSSYQYVESILDIDNYIDYWVGEFYTTNNDIVNTRFFSHPNIESGKIKMIFYDFDYAFYNYSFNYINWMTKAGGMGEFHYDNSILRGLLQNEKFQKRFLERLSYNMKNVWSDENVMNRYHELIDLIEPEMKRNQERWKMTYQEWQDSCKELEKYIKQRRSYLINQTKSYFHLTSKEVEEYFG